MPGPRCSSSIRMFFFSWFPKIAQFFEQCKSFSHCGKRKRFFFKKKIARITRSPLWRCQVSSSLRQWDARGEGGFRWSLRWWWWGGGILWLLKMPRHRPEFLPAFHKKPRNSNFVPCFCNLLVRFQTKKKSTKQEKKYGLGCVYGN